MNTIDNKKYSLLIDYTTGNSFGSHKEVGELVIEHNDLDLAKANLKRITEHHKLYKKIENYHNDWQMSRQDNFLTKQKLISDYKNDDWFVSELKFYSKKRNSVINKPNRKNRRENDDIIEIYDEYHAIHLIKLYSDEGESMQISCFWHGYFETLEAAYIELKKPEENNDMRVEFY